MGVLDGQVAVVTGEGSGIEAEVAGQLARDGPTVVIDGALEQQVSLS